MNRQTLTAFVLAFVLASCDGDPDLDPAGSSGDYTLDSSGDCEQPVQPELEADIDPDAGIFLGCTPAQKSKGCYLILWPTPSCKCPPVITTNPPH